MFEAPPLAESARPPRLRAPARPACVLAASIWPGHHVGLRFAERREVFAWVHDGDLALSLPVTPALRSAFATLRYRQGEITGVLTLSDVEFRPAQPLNIAGFLILEPTATITLTAAAPDAVRIAYRVDSGADLTLTPLVPLVATVRCSDVTYRPMESSTWTEFEGERAILKQRPVLLRQTLRGPALARLHAHAPLDVTVLERRDGQAQVALYRPSAVVVGWVDERALDAPPPIGRGTIRALGHGAGVGTGQGFGSVVTTARCPHDVAMIAEQGRERRSVGRVAKGVSIELGDWGELDVEASVHGAAWRAAEGTRLLVLQADLDGCTLRGPPEQLRREHRPRPWPAFKPQKLR